MQVNVIVAVQVGVGTRRAGKSGRVVWAVQAIGECRGIRRLRAVIVFDAVWRSAVARVTSSLHGSVLRCFPADRGLRPH